MTYGSNNTFYSEALFKTPKDTVQNRNGKENKLKTMGKQFEKEGISAG